jgi:hypothetical protein
MLYKSVLFLFFITLLGERLTAQDGLIFSNSPTLKGTESVEVGTVNFEFQTYVTENDLISISQDLLQEHPFGPLVSRKIYLLQSKYTFQVPVVPGNPQTKTVIRKAIIYDAVQKIEHHLKKSVRKKVMSNEQATQLFNQVLDVALNAFAADTTNFEKTINKMEDPSSLVDLFVKKVKLAS